MKQIHRGDAYHAVRLIYDQSPGRSWQRLNHALSATLGAAIFAHLSFERDDFRVMRAEMAGHYWMGNSCGSVCGEMFYGASVKAGHTPACISFEQYAGRPAALWPEKVKTPDRLCIGSEFTWEGLKVECTNLLTDKLIACHYQPGGSYREELGVGSVSYFSGGYRTIKSLTKKPDGGVHVGFGPAGGYPKRTPSRIFKIAYTELAEKRKALDAARKKALAEITTAESVESLDVVLKRLNRERENHRPFDIEEFKTAIAGRLADLKRVAA